MFEYKYFFFGVLFKFSRKCRTVLFFHSKVKNNCFPSVDKKRKRSFDLKLKEKNVLVKN